MVRAIGSYPIGHKFESHRRYQKTHEYSFYIKARKRKWPVGQAVKTPPFHGGNMGSSPVRVTKENRQDKIPPFFFVCDTVRERRRTHWFARASFACEALRGSPFKGVGDTRTGHTYFVTSKIFFILLTFFIFYTIIYL